MGGLVTALRQGAIPSGGRKHGYLSKKNDAKHLIKVSENGS